MDVGAVKRAIREMHLVLTTEISKQVKSNSCDVSESGKRLTTKDTVAVLSEYGQKDFIVDVYDCWKQGVITLEEWQEFLAGLLTNYIKSRIKNKNLLIGAEYEDLIQSGWRGVIEKAVKYDPHKTLPTTFFTEYIDQYMRESLDTKGLTKYYKGIAVKLDKYARLNNYSGCMDETLSDITLATISGESVMTVRETRKILSNKVVSWDANSDNIDLEESRYKSPEKAILDKERDAFLQDAFSKLNPLEQFLLYYTELKTKPVSISKMVEIIKKPEWHEKYADYLPNKAVDQNVLRLILSKALRKLQHNAPLGKYIAIRQARTFEQFEQATNEDIENAILTNMIEL